MIKNFFINPLRFLILPLILFTVITLARADSAFKVGVIAPLSGPLAEYGLAAKNGIELARLEHPELFNKIDFIFEDSQWDPKTAVSALNSLRDNQKVSLIYNWGNPTTEAVAPIAERYHVPLLGMSANPVVAIGKKYVIRTTNSSADFASFAAEYLVKKGYKNIGVVMADNSYVQGLFNGLKDSLGERAKIEVLDQYNIQDQDFRTSISKIRAKHYDCLGVFLISGQVSAFYRQLLAQSISMPTLGTDFFESTTEIKLAEGGMNNAVYPHLGVTPEFRTTYVGKYNNDYQLAYAGNGYDMAMVIGRLFNNLPEAISPEVIMSRLKSVKNQIGIGGTYSYVDSEVQGPHYHFPVQLKQIVGETIQVISTRDK